MACLVARTGRHRQRYENNLRLVSGVAKDDEDCKSTDPENKIEVLMISSPNRDDLVFPKGGWDDDETLQEAACREALEEAGVKGILKGNPLGVWEFRSKSSQEICSVKVGACKGYMFALEVTEELEAWPEQGNRDRKWLYIKEAFKLCRYEWMRRALEKFMRVIMTESSWKQEMQAGDQVVVDPLPCPVPISDDDDVVTVTECQVLSTNCYMKPSAGASCFWDYGSSCRHIAVADSGQGCG